MAKKQDSDRTSLIKAARRQIIHSAVLATAALGVIVSACYAWFANNQRVTANIGTIQMMGNIYELAGEGADETDNGYGVFYNIAKELKFPFSSLMPGDFIPHGNNQLESTNSSNSIRWRLNDDSHIGNHGDSTGILPDKQGELQFYVIPKVTGTLSLKFTLELNPLDDNGEAKDDQKLTDLLKGHILFSRDGDEKGTPWLRWDGDSFKMDFNVTPETVNQPQLVTLKWAWAASFDKFYQSLRDDIAQHSQLLFYDEDNTKISEETITSLLQNESKDELARLYNRADRYIFSNCTWLEVKLSAQLATS